MTLPFFLPHTALTMVHDSLTQYPFLYSVHRVIFDKARRFGSQFCFRLQAKSSILVDHWAEEAHQSRWFPCPKTAAQPAPETSCFIKRRWTKSTTRNVRQLHQLLTSGPDGGQSPPSRCDSFILEQEARVLMGEAVGRSQELCRRGNSCADSSAIPPRSVVTDTDCATGIRVESWQKQSIT